MNKIYFPSIVKEHFQEVSESLMQTHGQFSRVNMTYTGHGPIIKLSLPSLGRKIVLLAQQTNDGILYTLKVYANIEKLASNFGMKGIPIFVKEYTNPVQEDFLDMKLLTWMYAQDKTQYKYAKAAEHIGDLTSRIPATQDEDLFDRFKYKNILLYKNTANGNVNVINSTGEFMELTQEEFKDLCVLID